MLCDNTYVNIDLDAITANFRAIREKAGVPVMAVVKADAYGHGAVRVARQLQADCGFFGVSCIQEALELRCGGIDTPILILGRTPVAAYPQAIRNHIRVTLFRYEDALALSETATALGETALFHLAVDTGMSRIGFQVTEEAADTCAKIAALPGLSAEGLFSHFFASDSRDLTRAREQTVLFDRFYEMLCNRGIQVPFRHLDNSAGIMNFDSHYDMVRAGIITYGMYPSDEVDPGLLSLKPALSWHSRVAHVKWLEPGRSVSYGGTFVAQKPTMVATIPVGYADGYRRSLSGNFHVLIRGKQAPILGRVCMDQLMVDVTRIPDVSVDDPVVLIGTDGQARISIEEIAARAGSFNYEFASCIGRRVPRIYIRDGKVTEQMHYLLDK